MATTGIALVKQALRGLLGASDSSSTDVKTEVARLFRHTIRYPIPNTDGSNAAAAVTDAYFWRAPAACKVVSAYVLFDSSVTANNSNYATLKLQQADGAGGGLTVVANAATTVGGTNSMSAGVPKALTVQTAAVAAGAVLAFGATKAASGVDLPTGTLIVTLEEA